MAQGNKNQGNNQEVDVNKLRQVRRDKLAELQAMGKDPFQITKYRSDTPFSRGEGSLLMLTKLRFLQDRQDTFRRRNG